MYISANLSTIKARSHILPKVIDSLVNQVDIVRVYANDYTPDIQHPKVEIYTGKDLTDNAKFLWMKDVDEWYFTCDDDILYPPDYVENTLNYAKKYDTYVITYHGRKLKGKGLDYYRNHEVYHFLRTVKGNWQIDVPGTGVSCWNTSKIKFDPTEWEYELMSDLMSARECAIKGVPILCVQHNMWWLKSLLEPKDHSIYKTESKDCSVQNAVADEIYGINNS